MANKRTEIINNIISTLQTITVANGYSYDIQTIEEGLKLPEDVDPGKFPAAFIVDGDEDKRDLDACEIRGELDYIITCYVQKLDSEDNLQQRRRNFQADIENALMQDRGRGGIAIDTLVRRIETDKATLQEYAIADITVRIKYNYQVGNV